MRTLVGLLGFLPFLSGCGLTAEAYNDRGIAYNDLGQHQRAIQDYDEAIWINPQYKYAYRNLALVYTVLDLDVRAQQYVDRAVELGADRAELEEKLRHERTLR